MSNLSEIKRKIENLTPDELVQFRAWFENFCSNL